MSWHINPESPSDIAERVLMPGDPLRAKHIAETFLEDVKEYTHVRNMLGFTGTYKGCRVSVQGSGMGMPSFAIYANELITDFGVKKIIRTGTCGALQPFIHVRDVVFAQAATTDSGMVRNIFAPGMTFAPTGSYSLLEKAVVCARSLSVPFHVGNVLSQDRLYDDEIDLKKLTDYGVLAAEMETAALYLVAAKYRVESLGVFTVSNHILTGEETPIEERETSFNDMARIALETVIAE
ncbi:MAG: purine-nucleoside phosphorylase [Schwartzia sp.]|nr:purine-nucleoside phosphorylase [Schwartzia sp. (in: firmicutes)]MBR5163312.1 purine-nucleoside phosphorylase [Schwartzia sp. (in: firmicutes)]